MRFVARDRAFGGLDGDGVALRECSRLFTDVIVPEIERLGGEFDLESIGEMLHALIIDAVAPED